MKLRVLVLAAGAVLALSPSAFAQEDAAEDPAFAAMHQAEQAAQDAQQQAEQSAFQAQDQAVQAAMQSQQDAVDQAVDNTNAAVMRSTQGGSGYSHSESRSESSSTRITIGDDSDDSQDRAYTRPHWSNGWGRAAIPTDAMAGKWMLRDEGGKYCGITLELTQWLGSYRATVPAGCPDGFFFVNRWTLAGNELQLIDSYDKVIGRFRATTPDRWTGQRDSDGARMYLNR